MGGSESYLLSFAFSFTSHTVHWDGGRGLWLLETFASIFVSLEYSCEEAAGTQNHNAQSSSDNHSSSFLSWVQ
jgi:hypothetical protein